MRHTEDFFRHFLAQLLPVPRFRFDKKLYDELCRETPAGKKITAPGSQPEVVFELGPIDGELGRCDMKTGRITIDVLEHFLICTRGHLVTAQQLKERFDSRLTETLAHEGGHWQLDKRRGIWPMLEKFAISTLLAIFGLAIGVLVVVSYSRFIIGHLVPAMWGVHPIVGVLGLILTLLFYLNLVLRIVPVYISFCLAMSAIVTYKVCWHERYARSFAKRSKSDPRWSGVVEVD